MLDDWGVDRLGRWIPSDADLSETAREAAASSSMKANPCVLPAAALEACIRAAL